MLLGRRRRLLDVALERVELSGPERVVRLDPFRGFAHWRCVELAPTHASFPRALDEACALEHAKVFGDGGPRDAKRRGEIADGGFAGREAREESAPGGVGEGGEREVESVIGNHSVTSMGSALRPVNGHISVGDVR